MMVRPKDFLMVLSAATLLIIIFSTMFLSAKVKAGKDYQETNAASESSDY